MLVAAIVVTLVWLAWCYATLWTLSISTASQQAFVDVSVWVLTIVMAVLWTRALRRRPARLALRDMRRYTDAPAGGAAGVMADLNDAAIVADGPPSVGATASTQSEAAAANLSGLARLIYRYAKRKPYFHLYGVDGSYYMGRWWLFQTPWLSARLHHIARADNDRHFHDHPFNFWSFVVQGFYWEQRPRSIEPCFPDGSDREAGVEVFRPQWSLASRQATDRHLISEVSPGGVWTVFIFTKKRQWWGFYTPRGKVYWNEYLDVAKSGGGEAAPVAESATTKSPPPPPPPPPARQIREGIDITPPLPKLPRESRRG